MKNLKVTGYINKTTGEYFDAESIIEVTNSVETKKIFRSIQNSNDYINKNLGYYFHLLYEDILKLDLKPQMLIRFLKLCSYANYKNVLVTGETKGQRTIQEKELENILNLKDKEARSTKKYLLENNLISIEKDLIKVDIRFIRRGKLKGDIKDMDITRVFNRGIQELYDNVKPTQHKKLVTFIKILPYINIKYNIICDNPLETDIEKIRPITWTELGRRIGLSEIMTKRLKSELWKLKINNSVCVGEFSTFLCGKSIVVNPVIYYKGNNIENLKGIMNLFKLNK